VAGIKNATTYEIDPKSDVCVIGLMESQKEKMKSGNYGNTMRLGAYDAVLKKGTIARACYGADTIIERHRHRYEVEGAFIPQIEKAGMVFSGTSPDGHLMEIAELPKDIHPFFVGTQFHPEFLARPLQPHPLFTGFIKAAIAKKKIEK
jgi:CTP synthase